MELSTDGHEGTFRGMEMFRSLIVVMGTWLHTFVKLLELHTQKRGWILLYVNSACILLVWVTQSCPTLCDPVDRNPPGSSVHGILQARILEWVATFSSRRNEWGQFRAKLFVRCCWLWTAKGWIRRMGWTSASSWWFMNYLSVVDLTIGPSEFTYA